MGGFKNEGINIAFDIGTIDNIIAHLTRCSKQMKDTCIASGNLLENDEDFITNRLIDGYLNEKLWFLRFEPQASEHYDSDTGRYVGRIDIKVTSWDYYFRDAKAYHIIESKRIDGTKKLSQKYVTDGVDRFLSPTPQQPKYSSYYQENMIFGYVVKTIIIPDSADEIDSLQNSLLKGVTASKFVLQQSDTEQYYVYTCQYMSANIGRVELSHLFYNFADAIR